MTARQSSDHVRPGATDERAQVDAVRFWLVSGIHKFAVDPRRRLGRHALARQLLTQEYPPQPESAGAWRSLASTLDRHTVLGGMTELSSQERRALVLAYLEGRTNREIAIGLGLSVGTVRRLLRTALERIDIYLTRTGTWLVAIVLLGAGHVTDAATRLGRPANTFGSAEWAPNLVSTAAVGAIAAAALGAAAISSDPIGPMRSSTPATVHTIAATAGVGVGGPSVAGIRSGGVFDADGPEDSDSNAQPPATAQTQLPKQNNGEGKGQNQKGQGQNNGQGRHNGQGQGQNKIHTGNGGGGKPTGSPPPVPVGPP